MSTKAGVLLSDEDRAARQAMTKRLTAHTVVEIHMRLGKPMHVVCACEWRATRSSSALIEEAWKAHRVEERVERVAS